MKRRQHLRNQEFDFVVKTVLNIDVASYSFPLPSIRIVHVAARRMVAAGGSPIVTTIDKCGY